MKLDLRRFKIEKAAGRSDYRPAIAQPYLDVEEKVIVATDTFMMAIVPVELDDGDTSGAVPTQALVEARRRTTKTKPQGIRLNGRAEVGDGDVSFKRPAENSPFPAWRTIADKKRGKPVAEFGINPFFLARLAEAIGCVKDEAVKVTYYGPTESLVIEPLRSTGRGVLMPVRIS